MAVLTGAGGGIGRALALALAKKGCRLALCDIDTAALARVAQEVSALGVHCSSHRLDVADQAAVLALPQQVQASHPHVHLLINNAGVALGGNFEQVSADDFDWLMAINFHAVVRTTRAFLPLLRRAGESRIVNISSVYGLVSPPGQAAYSAAKFAVRGFSNALRQELAGTGVGVTVVHPGGVATAIARNARLPAGIEAGQVEARRKEFDRLLRLPPERAADDIVAAIERNAARVLVGTDAKIAALLERLMPVGHMGVLTWLAQRQLSSKR